MFGGLAFLLGGNMAVAASGEGGIMVRVEPQRTDELTAGGEATILEMRGRPMRGWLRVAPRAPGGRGGAQALGGAGRRLRADARAQARLRRADLERPLSGPAARGRPRRSW